MLYTNGAYEIDGNLILDCVYPDDKTSWLIGIVTKSKYPYVYKVGDKIEVPLYHTSGNPEPQFFTYAQLRERKLKRILIYES